MHKIEIPDIGFTKEIPSELSECSPAQFLYFVKMFLLLRSGEIDYPKFRFLLLINFLDVRPSGRYFTENEREFILCECSRLSEILDSFLTTGEADFTLNLNFTQNLLREIKLRNGSLFGPSDALLNICFQEYIDAYHFFTDYLKTDNEDSLNKLVAVLYRPKKRFLSILSRLPGFNGQQRQDYNPHLIEARAVKVGKLPFHVRFAVFLFFRGCEEFLRKGEITLTGSVIEFSLLYEQSGEDQEDHTGLIGLLYTLAESNVFGTAKETAKENLYDVMVRVYQVMNAFKIQERRAKK